MEPILNRNDFEKVLKSERAVIYVYVDWSSYAAQTGLRIMKQNDTSNGPLILKYLFGWRT